MPGKYAPLETYLRDLPESQRDIKLRFEYIEKLLNSKLPASAHELSWWEHETEGNHRNTRAWANASWRVDAVDFARKWVRFIRMI